jgi:hypothetical protein
MRNQGFNICKGIVLAAGLACMAGFPVHAQVLHEPEPGLTPGVKLTNISNVPHDEWTSVFPMVAVSRSNPKIVAVAWRRFAMPVFAVSSVEQFEQCYISLSKDGGKTFSVTDERPYLTVDGDGTPARPSLANCNAPYVAIANDGTLYAGGTTTPVNNNPPQGRLGVIVSHDLGVTWSQSIFGITTERLAPGLSSGSTEPPSDGANGIVDPQTGTFYSATSRFISASHDKGKTFGTAYASYGTASAAFGTLVAAVSERNFEGGKCPCLVVSISRDEGKTWSRNIVAQAGEWDPTGTVRYPIAAANPAKAGSYAVGVYAPDHKSIQVYYTADYGKTWKMATPKPIPPTISFNTVSQVDPGYTSDGKILVTWRAWRNVAAHNTFVAMLDGDTFGPTVKVTPELSIDPPMTFAGWYQGDFTNWVTGNDTDAYVAFVFAPKGQNEDTWLARVPLSLLK